MAEGHSAPLWGPLLGDSTLGRGPHQQPLLWAGPSLRRVPRSTPPPGSQLGPPFPRASVSSPAPQAALPQLTHQALPFLLLPRLLLGLQLHHRQGWPHRGAGQGAGCEAGQQAQPALLQAWRQGSVPGPQPIASSLVLLCLQPVLALVLGALIWRAENRGSVPRRACAARPHSQEHQPRSSLLTSGGAGPPTAQCPIYVSPSRGHPTAHSGQQLWESKWLSVRDGNMHVCCGEDTDRTADSAPRSHTHTHTREG